MKIKDLWKSVLIEGYVNIEATASLRDASNNWLQGKQGLAFFGLDTFQPMILVWNWQEAARLEISVAIDYHVRTPAQHSIGTPFDVSKGTYRFYVAWKVRYEESGCVLYADTTKDLGSSGEGPFAVGVQLS